MDAESHSAALGRTPVTGLQPRTVVVVVERADSCTQEQSPHSRPIVAALRLRTMAGIVPATERNPISLVKVEHATSAAQATKPERWKSSRRSSRI